MSLFSSSYIPSRVSLLMHEMRLSRASLLDVCGRSNGASFHKVTRFLRLCDGGEASHEIESSEMDASESQIVEKYRHVLYDHLVRTLSTLERLDGSVVEGIDRQLLELCGTLYLGKRGGSTMPCAYEFIAGLREHMQSDSGERCEWKDVPLAYIYLACLSVEYSFDCAAKERCSDGRDACNYGDIGFSLGESFCTSDDRESCGLGSYAFGEWMNRMKRGSVLFCEDFKQFICYFPEGTSVQVDMYRFHEDVTLFCTYLDLPGFLFHYISRHQETYDVAHMMNLNLEARNKWVLPLLRFAAIQFGKDGECERKEKAILGAAFQNACYYYSIHKPVFDPAATKLLSSIGDSSDFSALLNTILLTRKCFVALSLLSYMEKSLVECCNLDKKDVFYIDPSVAMTSFKAFPDIYNRLICRMSYKKWDDKRLQELSKGVGSPVIGSREKFTHSSDQVVDGIVALDEVCMFVDYYCRLYGALGESSLFSSCGILRSILQEFKVDSQCKSCSSVMYKSCTRCICDHSYLSSLLEKLHIYFPSYDVLGFDYYLKLGCSFLASKSYVDRFGSFKNGHELGCLAAYNLALSYFDNYVVLSTCFQFIESIEHIFLGSDAERRKHRKQVRWGYKLLVDCFAAKRIYEYVSEVELRDMLHIGNEHSGDYKDLVSCCFQCCINKEVPLGNFLGGEIPSNTFGHETFSSTLYCNIPQTAVLRCLENATERLMEWKGTCSPPFVLENWWNLPLAYAVVNSLSMSTGFIKRCCSTGDILCLLHHFDKHGFSGVEILRHLSNISNNKGLFMHEHMHCLFESFVRGGNFVENSVLKVDDIWCLDPPNNERSVTNPCVLNKSLVDRTKVKFFEAIGIPSNGRKDDDIDHDSTSDSGISFDCDSHYVQDCGTSFGAYLLNDSLFAIVEKCEKSPENACHLLLRHAYASKRAVLVLAAASQTKADIVACCCTWLFLLQNLSVDVSSGECSPGETKRELRHSHCGSKGFEYKVNWNLADLQDLIISFLNSKSYSEILNCIYIFCFDSPLYYLLLLCYLFYVFRYEDCESLNAILTQRLSVEASKAHKYGWGWQTSQMWINHFIDAVLFLELKSYLTLERRKRFADLVLGTKLLSSETMKQSFERTSVFLGSISQFGYKYRADICEEEYIDFLSDSGYYDEAFRIGKLFGLNTTKTSLLQMFAYLKRESDMPGWNIEEHRILLYGKAAERLTTTECGEEVIACFFGCLLTDQFVLKNPVMNSECEMESIRQHILKWCVKSKRLGRLTSKNPRRVFAYVYEAFCQSFQFRRLSDTVQAVNLFAISAALIRKLITGLLRAGCFSEATFFVDSDNTSDIEVAYTSWAIASGLMLPFELPYKMKLILEKNGVDIATSPSLYDSTALLKHLASSCVFCRAYCEELVMKCQIGDAFGIGFLEIQRADPYCVYANMLNLREMQPLARAFADMSSLDSAQVDSIFMKAFAKKILSVIEVHKDVFEVAVHEICENIFQCLDSLVEKNICRNKLGGFVIGLLNSEKSSFSFFHQILLLRFAAKCFSEVGHTSGIASCSKIGHKLCREGTEKKEWMLLSMMFYMHHNYYDAFFVLDSLLEKQSLSWLNKLLVNPPYYNTTANEIVEYVKRERLGRRSTMRSFLTGFVLSSILVDSIIEESKVWPSNLFQKP